MVDDLAYVKRIMSQVWSLEGRWSSPGRQTKKTNLSKILIGKKEIGNRFQSDFSFICERKKYRS